jgi:nucleolar complex protein 3
LEAVRFLNRMIKEKRFSVHPNALRCLYHLRLKKELDVRGSQNRIDKANPDESQWKIKKKDRQHLSKKAKKVRKENKAIEGEMREAEAEVDAEQRSAHVSLLSSRKRRNLFL